MSTIAKAKEIGNNTEERKTAGASQRAELLAARIEQGVAGLAAFSETLSDREWHQPVPESGKLGRSVGVIVHHVASVYPIEIQTACAIAGGAPLTDLTWEAVAHLNADHARENVGLPRPRQMIFCVATAEKLPTPSVDSRTKS